MRPFTTLATAPGGYALKARGGEYLVLVGGRVLMGSRAHGSEDALARVGCAGLRAGARVLVGGLGFGFTLRAALDALGPDARVTVAELSAPVVEWNRGPLAPLAGRPLEDARVDVEVRDVREVLAAARARFDAVLLDVDNGPFAVAAPGNAALYAEAGLRQLARALRPGGRAVVWSAGDDAAFLKRLAAVGPARAQRAGGHVLFVATKRGP